MRKYAILKEPIKCNDKDFIYKIMLYQSKKEVLLFKYCNMGDPQWGQFEILKNGQWVDYSL